MWAAVAAVLFAAGTWLLFWQSQPVDSVRPRHGAIVSEVFGTGTLESKVVVGVSAKITGKVVDVSVDQGDLVAAGQCLARLESTDFENAVRVAAAQRDEAAVLLAKAKVDTDRQRSLVEQNLIAHATFEQYETANRVAAAHLNTAEASLGVARAKLADTRIVSPAAGQVVTRNLEIGATVVPGAPIFRIATSPPWVEANVDERATGALRIGQAVRVLFETNPDHPEPGHVVRLAAEVDRVTEEREVDVALDRLPPAGFLGQRADVYVELARAPNALQVPSTAVVVRDGKPGVFVIDSGRARWTPVRLGLRGRSAVEITSGVGEGDPLVANPAQDKIGEGARVTIRAREGAL